MVDSGAQGSFLNQKHAPLIEIEDTQPLASNITSVDVHVIIPAKDSNLLTLICEFGDFDPELTHMITAPTGQHDAIARPTVGKRMSRLEV